MKAIIISDDESAIKKIDACLVDAGYNTIIYRWLLKALDNVEEIAPDVILINVCDYPRHWKTFVQHAKSNLQEKNLRVILYAPEHLTDEEQKKADALGVAGVFHSCDDEGLQTVRTVLGIDENRQMSDSEQAKREDDTSQSFVASAPHTKNAAIFTHPETSAFVTGSASFQDDNMIEFAPDVPSLASGLSPGDCIDEFSYKCNGECAYSTAEVVSSGLTILLKLGSEAA